MNESQRAMVAVKIANIKHGGDRKGENIKGPIGLLITAPTESQRAIAADKLLSASSQPPVSQEQAAKMLNVSERSVKRLAVSALLLQRRGPVPVQY